MASAGGLRLMEGVGGKEASGILGIGRLNVSGVSDISDAPCIFRHRLILAGRPTVQVGCRKHFCGKGKVTKNRGLTPFLVFLVWWVGYNFEPGDAGMEMRWNGG